MAASIGEGDGAGGCTTGSGLTSGGLTGSGGVGSSTAAGGGATICGTSINSITTGFCGCMIGTTSKTTRAASIAAWTTPSTAIIGQLVRLSCPQTLRAAADVPRPAAGRVGEGGGSPGSDRGGPAP